MSSTCHQQLLQHINSQDPHIQFTVEEPNEEGALPFLHTLVSSGPNNRRVTTVYRKPIHTDQCSNWESNQFITNLTVVPYIHGLGERFKRTCNNLGTQVHFRGTSNIKTLLMAPKDRDNKLPKSVVLYRLKCPHINCPEEYIGKSGRFFGDCLKEHLSPLPYTSTQSLCRTPSKP